jgi:hypothetical protein
MENKMDEKFVSYSGIIFIVVTKMNLMKNMNSIK